ncbi:MAG: T9SS type A sorting domain-containing protein [Bacteroidia bacterium]
MKKNYLLFLLGIYLQCTSFAQCVENDEVKVLLVGDSWAFFMAADQTINNVLEKWGHSHYKYFTNTTLAENGAETNDFLTATKQDEIAAQLAANPSVEVVHLSIGGNDFLGDWNTSMTQTEVDSMIDSVEARLILVMNFIKSVKPNIQILWSGYTYPNFEEIIESAAPFQTNHPYYSNWEDMGFPTFLQINDLLNKVSQRMEQYLLTDPQVHFINATGVLQHTFGQNNPLGVPPSGTYAPYSAPLPLGFPNYPSPQNAMRNYLLTKDCFHLAPQGFSDLLEYHTQKFYHKFLMDDFYTLANGTHSGTVSSLGNVSNTLEMGENNGENFSTLLSFDTQNMADTTLLGASIFLRRESLVGTNPINNTLEIKVKKGNLGASAIVEADDYTATADVTATPCLFGSNNGNKHWIRLDLPASFLPFIQQGNATQFLLSSPNASNGKVMFSDATNPDFAPVLNLVYEKPTVALENKADLESVINVYPNPTQNVCRIDAQGKKILSIQIFNAMGQLVGEGKAGNALISLATFPTGIYTLQVKTEDGEAWKKVVKQ